MITAGQFVLFTLIISTYLYLCYQPCSGLWDQNLRWHISEEILSQFTAALLGPEPGFPSLAAWYATLHAGIAPPLVRSVFLPGLCCPWFLVGSAAAGAPEMHWLLY